MDYHNYKAEDFVLDESFRRWVSGTDEESHIFWSQWLDEHPEKAATVAQAIELLKQLPVQQDQLSVWQRTALTQAIEDGIDRWEASTQKAHPPSTIPISAYAMARQKIEAQSLRKFRTVSLLVKGAACAIFAIGMAYLAYRSFPEPPPVIVYEQVVKEAPAGRKLTVFLDDKSQVMLNAASKITFTRPFHPDHRTVTLEGEAFFEVAEDSLRPFRVVSGELTTTALGTSFNIAAYPQHDRIQVSLTSGQVKVDCQPQAEAYYLKPGEQVDYDRKQQRIAKSSFNTDDVLAWKAGVIHLKNADQATVIETLERWYGVPIVVQGTSATAWDVTAKFNNQSLKSVLTSLSYTMGFDAEITKDCVFINY